MPFHFPLQTLLRLKQNFEEMEQRRLEALGSQVNQIRLALESLDRDGVAAREQLAQGLQNGLHSGDVQVDAVLEEARKQRQLALRAREAEMEQKRRAQQVVYQRARQQREILDNLRKRQFAVYRREEARREQQRVDEMFLLRRNVRRV